MECVTRPRSIIRCSRRVAAGLSSGSTTSAKKLLRPSTVLLLIWLGVGGIDAQSPSLPPSPPPSPPAPPPWPFVAGLNGAATVLPPDLRSECAHFDSARNVLVSRFDSSAATAWRDLQFGVAAGRNQSIAFEEVEGAAATAYSNSTGPPSAGWTLDMTSAAGVLTSDLPNWSTDPAAPFTIVVIQSLKARAIDWQANYLIAELSCAGSPGSSGFLFGTRESYMSGAFPWNLAFETSKPVPVESGWTLHAFVRRKGGREGAYYYAGASGGIALREAFTGQPPMSIGPDRFTVGTSKCMSTAKSRTQLGVVLVYNRALSVTDLKRIQETYARRFGWSSGGPSSLVCIPGIDMKGNPLSDTAVPSTVAPNATACQAACARNASCEFSVFDPAAGPCWLRRSAVNGSAGTNAGSASATTCFSRPNYGNYYCIPSWDIKGSFIRTLSSTDKSTCLGACDRDPTCQFAAVASGTDDCILRRDIFTGAVGTTQQNLGRGAAYETCIKARVHPFAVECGKWTKGGPGETRLQKDCDGDGLLDAVLFDTTGARGVALSTRGCSTADANTGYPDAPASACPAVLGALCPKPPGDWCPGGKVLQLDCDADGVKDLACDLEGDRSALRVVRSGLGCWPGAADAFCPPLTANGSCGYPAGNLCSEGRMLSVDCNNDNIRDWVCLGAGGQRGVVPSRGCDPSPAASGYPQAADRSCPVLFGVGVTLLPPVPPTPPMPPRPPPPRPPPPPFGCVAYPGYSHQLGVDHPGDDLGNLGSEAAARAACSSRPDCRGFTSLGRIKSTVVGTMLDNPALCLYTKIDSTCPSVSGFTVHSDLDRPGDNIGGPLGSLAAAASACAVTPGCRGYTSTGFLKSTPLPTTTYAHPVCLYAQITVCPMDPGPPMGDNFDSALYEVYPDADHVGDDLATTPLSAAHDACQADNFCAAFNLNGQLKNVDGSPNAYAYGVCLYVRKPNVFCFDISTTQEPYNLTASKIAVGPSRQGTMPTFTAAQVCHEADNFLCQYLSCDTSDGPCTLYEFNELSETRFKFDACFYEKMFPGFNGG
ncbi:hypothetical protein HYH03_017580 [Edaphochlamys debaryana]|uniref:Apple domain-containing protein n=1 Tax=Edaphochlamys debaryana TaxID=47281 RepID=A0A835XGC6_9CHLO|nr:hypothetical protein HYH03_017580 [Edaphochlamys debaryana]|eukprot:KAG2483573.1 hypothetical protein HYH03_017580 [Edaphochlamys debaryana]